MSTDTQAVRPAQGTEDSGYEELAAIFRPTFSKIAERAVDREQRRDLPYQEVGWLKDLGFGALRVPKVWGGHGASITDLFRLLIELAEADSNLPQLLRGHFAFTESRLSDVDHEAREVWARRIAGGELIGNASSELGNTSLADRNTTLTRDGDRWLLNGTKYYSTGTLFADWASVGGVRAEELVSVVVRTDAPGVERIDDWDGFGQRLTGSGTTRFTDVEIDPAQIYRWSDREPSHVTAFFQLVLLASLAGIGRAVLRDATGFVRPRTRSYAQAAATLPKDDPQVQQVVGELSALAFAAESTVIAAAAHTGAAADAGWRDEHDQQLVDRAEVAAYDAQVAVIDLVLRATTRLFEVGGASSTSEQRRLDRHWRNARTLANHNPVIYKARLVGDWLLNDVPPSTAWRRAREEADGTVPGRDSELVDASPPSR
ncbi:acyl-CoA dehydrogenase family protein [Microlunatus sp. GCM10028923]|uniref:acyl-CoA dehydrogenase family protein n=1 Tax=Microlunatus sp. GCM10028923 TaxID=3273400 RepID=UPI003611E28F